MSSRYKQITEQAKKAAREFILACGETGDASIDRVRDLEGWFLRGAQFADANPTKGTSIIHWETGEPKENDVYFVSLVFANSVTTTLLNYYRGAWLNFNGSEFPSECVIAWCKLSDIEPYKQDEV